MSDISREAVERMARDIGDWEKGFGRKQASDMLRALLARVGELEASMLKQKEDSYARGHIVGHRKGCQQGLDAALSVLDRLCKKYAEATYETKAGRKQNAAKCYLAGEAYELIQALKAEVDSDV